MTRKLELWLLVTLITATMGAVWAQNGVKIVNADQAAIQQVLSRYAATVDAGDLASWMGLWAPGGVQMPPGAPMRSGLQAIRAGMAPALTQYDDDIHINIVEITVAGTWGYARGTYTLDAAPREDRRGEIGDAGNHVDGKFLTVFRQQNDGTWKIYRDIFNSNVSPN